MTTLGVISTVIHLRTFGSGTRTLLLREASSGVRVGIQFAAANVVDLTWVLLAPAVLLSTFYYVVLPEMGFSDFYWVALGVTWWVSGMAYLVSCLVPARSSLVTGGSVDLS